MISKGKPREPSLTCPPLPAPQAQSLLDKAAPHRPSSSSSSPVTPTSAPPLDTHTKAVSSLLSTPVPHTPLPGAPRLLSPSPSPRLGRSRSPPARTAAKRSSPATGPAAAARAPGRGGSTSISSCGSGYRMFLERLTRSESKGFVEAIRLFLFSILGNGGAVNPTSGRPREAAVAAGRDRGRTTEEVEVYGSSFLVQRCACVRAGGGCDEAASGAGECSCSAVRLEQVVPGFCRSSTLSDVCIHSQRAFPRATTELKHQHSPSSPLLSPAALDYLCPLPSPHHAACK